MTSQGTSDDRAPGRCLVVIPTLNEARHIWRLLDQILDDASELGATVVVADGGSTDGTAQLVRDRAALMPAVVLLDNPRRIQSAGINSAVARFGDGAEYVIRIDAHGSYPPGYCRTLVAEADRTGADSVVVSLDTAGGGVFQQAVATAQNSFVGTGGAKHRSQGGGSWVDHGHHALMRIDAFRSVGGYDETFRTNEDAELDYRLGKAGYRIWMSELTRATYFPRASPAALFRQYFRYGQGRARNILKHHMVPRPRQALPLAVAPAVVLAGLAGVHWVALLPFAAWSAATLSFAVLATARKADKSVVQVVGVPLVGLAAMIMHFAWSSGFWVQVFTSVGRRA